ncbi:MAG: chromate transporter, partial [Clostridia bacterium]|nr:chromate transporter [Clostridia bacterium]
MNVIKKYLQLFWAFFKIGLFTFGGGYAMISVIYNEIVEKRKYISEDEFADVVAIAESTPGPIAINSATYIGFKRGGVLGAILSSVAVTLPSLIIIFAISLFLDRFMEIELVRKA